MSHAIRTDIHLRYHKVTEHQNAVPANFALLTKAKLKGFRGEEGSLRFGASDLPC